MISERDIVLEPVEQSNKDLLDNLWQFYELESSVWSETDIDASGRYTSLEELLGRLGAADAFEWGFIIRYQMNIVGFIIVADEFLNGVPIREFADIYILPKYRGLGIATAVTCMTLSKASHPWLLCVYRKDEIALKFWKNAFNRLQFKSISENNPPEVDEFYEFIINDTESIHLK